MAGHDIIVIGASAGGVEALTTITAALPGNLPATIFVVLHLPPDSASLLHRILGRKSNLPVLVAEDKLPIELSHVYIAPPDHHLILEKDAMRVIRGPKENRHRPAVDPLFRSAAFVYGPRAIGVVLTGALDDGTAGLLAIKQRGGLTVVQDPSQAMYPGMPSSAVANVAVDHIVSLANIGPLLTTLAGTPVQNQGELPMAEDLEREVKIAKMDADALNSNKHNGQPSVFSCPECHGVLWEMHDGDLVRYRCRVGHAYSVESMMAEQNDTLEEALWSALKTLQESAELSQRLAQQARDRNQIWLAKRFEDKMAEAINRANTIEKVLQNNSLSEHLEDKVLLDDSQGSSASAD